MNINSGTYWLRLIVNPYHSIEEEVKDKFEQIQIHIDKEKGKISFPD
jgi:hypothetical protein